MSIHIKWINSASSPRKMGKSSQSSFFSCALPHMCDLCWQRYKQKIWSRDIVFVTLWLCGKTEWPWTGIWIFSNWPILEFYIQNKLELPFFLVRSFCNGKKGFKVDTVRFLERLELLNMQIHLPGTFTAYQEIFVSKLPFFAGLFLFFCWAVLTSFFSLCLRFLVAGILPKVGYYRV